MPTPASTSASAGAEQRRLLDAQTKGVLWKKWGPYLSERQWGTVREDYSLDGNAWSYFTHDQARSRAYRWGEDGLAGLSDDAQRLCFALALWNGQDPILKERLFGLTNPEGNHGEDVKEYYFYLDSTPTHSYMKYLYKYPQRAFPYNDLVETNRRRSRHDFEYELLDTGIFDDQRYFDVFVEYAKRAPEDLLIRITAHNRGPDPAPLHLLPTLWFRNTWSWSQAEAKPGLCALSGGIETSHLDLGGYILLGEDAGALLFTENESKTPRLEGRPNPSPYVKDAFHEYLIAGRREAVNPAGLGTKAAIHYALQVPAGGSRTVRLRLRAGEPQPATPAFGPEFERTFAARRAEADAFYEQIAPAGLNQDQRRLQRQAMAGMLWSKQYYFFDVDVWLQEHGVHPLLSASRATLRNVEWFHMLNHDIISMPDKWEYPWYAAWDLAFHTLALAHVDFDFAKTQLLLMLRSRYFHPNGQIPAYEWNFSDVNPPVHAWATLWLFNLEKIRGQPDYQFLQHAFQSLLLNFNWWVNRKDPTGRSVFSGGFLGLDNIGVFDRSAQLPGGGSLEQADGTAWMAFFALNMLEIALALAAHDPAYQDQAFRFVQHFVSIAYAMDRIGDQHASMWDEDDGFYYDLLRFPDGQAERLKVRSLVGLLPLCASAVLEPEALDRLPQLEQRITEFAAHHPEVLEHIAPADKRFIGCRGRRLLSIVTGDKLRRVLRYLLDENEFLSPYGIRSLSRYHLDHPYIFPIHGHEFRVQYLPAESDTGMFGGNSNWRGPVWMPVNQLLLRALFNLYQFYGDEFTVECPTGSGRQLTLFQIAQEISARLTRLFLRDASGRRPVFGGARLFQQDPHWRDHLLFYEYFHGDNGAGLGASHQTGWTGTIALNLALAQVSAREALETPKGRLVPGRRRAPGRAAA
ncbi:MAG: MGH1-like glycoside hydrolase domain-containing protein [Terriglobales bacterium]